MLPLLASLLLAFTTCESTSVECFTFADGHEVCGEKTTFRQCSTVVFADSFD